MRAVGLAVFALWCLTSPAAAGVAPQLVTPAAKALVGAGALIVLAAVVIWRVLRRRRRAFSAPYREAGRTTPRPPSHDRRALAPADL